MFYSNVSLMLHKILLNLSPRQGLTFCIIILSGLSQILMAQTSLDPSHHVPVDKKLSAAWKESLWHDEQKVYKGEELTTIGMPCGGIAAGQLYVRGDGTLANWWIANNAYNTGYGIDSLMQFDTPLGPWKVCYQTFQPISYIEQGVSVTVRQNNKTRTAQLSTKDFDDISFIGEYPIAKIHYASQTNPLPLQIEAEVFSPFIPMNARESATPGTIMKYTLRNTSSQPMQVSLTGWLQNLVCLELKDEILAHHRNRVVKQAGKTSVVMDLVKSDQPLPAPPKITLFEDFESASYGSWKVEGNAFGTAPVRGHLPDQQPVKGYTGSYLVNSFKEGDESTGVMTSAPFTISDDYIVFNIGGGAHKGKTCLNLVVNDKIVRSSTGSNFERLETKSWEVKELKGQQAYFQIVDQETGGWGHINVDDIGFSQSPYTKSQYFPENHAYFGNLTLSLLADQASGTADFTPGDQNFNPELAKEKTAGETLVGAAQTTFDLAPGASKDVTFLITWYFPNRPKDYSDGGNWNRAIPTDGPAIGNMYANWFGSSLEVAQWLQKNLDWLSQQTHTFHKTYYQSSLPYWLAQRIMMPVSTLATETCQWWATDKFWAWEGVGSCVGTCTHVWNYEQALARLFPELERNIREKTDFDVSFQQDGSILARNGWGGVLIDGHAGAILKAYREHLLSKDELFLARNWEKIKMATEFLMKEDENGDGLIEKSQANTYDIAFYGANTYVGGLYLAALKAASAMAAIMEDTVFARHCDTVFETGRQLTADRLWNGEYFVQDVDLEEHAQFQYAEGCLSDQLFGQTWSHLIDLGYIYPEKQVKTALQSIWKYNWTPDIGEQNQNHPPERVFADPGEPGLFVCTWPKSQHLGEDGVRYRDEVWTGIEYQVATNMIYEGMIEEGLSMVKSVHERYNPIKHNPWNEIECGDHYARALASWGVLLALEGYHYNGPEKYLRYVPKVQPENFKGFFTGAEGWGNLSQSRTSGKQQNSVAVAYGKVPLTTLAVEVLRSPQKVQLFAGEREVPCTFEMENNQLTLHFEEVTVTEKLPLKLSIDF